MYADLDALIYNIDQNNNTTSIANFDCVFGEAILTMPKFDLNAKKIFFSHWNKKKLFHNWNEIENFIHDYFCKNLKIFYESKDLNSFFETVINCNMIDCKVDSAYNICDKYIDVFIYAKCSPNKQNIINLLSYGTSTQKFFDLFKDLIDEDILVSIFHRIKSSETKLKSLIKSMVDNQMITNKILTNLIYLFKCSNLCNVFKCSNICTILNECEYAFTEKDLNIFCYYCDPESIQIILNQKVNFTENSVNIMFSHDHGYKYSCIDIFTQFGYVISKDILIKMLEFNILPKKIDIKNEYLQDEVFMKTVKSIIDKKEMFPNDFGIIEDSDSLVEMIKNKKKTGSEIKKLIKEKKIKPTIECLRNACLHKSNILLIKYLIEEHKLVPDYDCIKISIELMQNSQLSYIFDNYPK